MIPKLMITALAMAGLCACASPKATTSGFLSNYEGLAAHPLKPHLRAEMADPKRVAAYTSVHVDTPEILAANLSPSQAEAVSADLSAALKDEFSGYFTIADTAGPGVLTLKTAVTDLKKSNVALNIATTAILGPVDFGTLSIEGEAVDAQGDERIAAIAWAKSSSVNETFQTFTPTGSARAIMPLFAADFAVVLGKAKEQAERRAREESRSEEEASSRER